MKTPARLAACLLLLPACFPTTRPLAPAPPARTAAFPPRDRDAEREDEREKALVAEWEWFAGGGR